MQPSSSVEKIEWLYQPDMRLSLLETQESNQFTMLIHLCDPWPWNFNSPLDKIKISGISNLYPTEVFT